MSTDPQVTDWLRGDPVNVGWYDVQWTDLTITRRWWSGDEWLLNDREAVPA